MRQWERKFSRTGEEELQVSQHPSREMFDALVRGTLAPAELATLREHLRSRCRCCWRRLAVAVGTARRSGRPPELSAYDRSIDAAHQSARALYETIAHERASAGRLLPPYIQSEASLEAWLESASDHLTWGFCECLLDAAEALRGKDPREAARLAELAAFAGDRLDPERYGSTALADFRASLWAELGNAQRAADRFDLAEHALRRALELRRSGSGDPLLLARIAELFASLRTAQRVFGEAVRFLDIAYSLYLAQEDRRSAGRVQVNKGVALGHSGDAEEGIVHLQSALRLLEPRRDGRLVFTALHNSLVFLVDLERYREARLLLFDTRPLYDLFARPLDLIKLRGIEGRIFAGLGDLERAERALAQTRDGFERLGLSYYTAVASLDLGEVWLRQGRTVELLKLLDELVAAFRVVGVEREALAALLMLRDALRRDAGDLDALRLAAAFLKRLKRDPGAAH